MVESMRPRALRRAGAVLVLALIVLTTGTVRSTLAQDADSSTDDAQAAAAGDSSRAGAPPSPAPTVSPAFGQGQADRQAFEGWFAAQTGDYLAGASYWTANRSHRPPPSCGSAPFPVDSAWTAGCLEASRRLQPTDLMRQSSPDYRRGWNSIVVTVPPPSQVPTVSPPPGQPDSSALVTSDQTPAAPAEPDNVIAAPPAASPTPTSGIAVGVMALVGLIVILSIAIYFIPTLIAVTRHKRNAGAIFALNLFLGWTLLGWVGALVWALLADAHLVRTVD